MNVKARNIRILDYYTVNNNTNPDTSAINVYSTQHFLLYSSVEEVKGLLDVKAEQSKQHFFNGLCAELKTIWVKGIWKDVDLYKPKALNIECLEYMIDNAVNTSAITITLHPNVYAQVSDELFGKASNKNITIATTE